MQNRFSETAVARTGAETELTIAVFNGPVFRKRKNSAANREGMAQLRGPKKTRAPQGRVRATLQKESRYRARWSVRSQRWANHPPTTVPAIPSTTVMALTVWLAPATDWPAKRWRKVGTQVEIPPMAKVSAARPKVAVRKAGFVNSPRNVARLRVGATWSFDPRAGSRPIQP